VDGDPVGTCSKCGQRPGTVKWLGELGMLAATHGMHQWWCEVCVNEAHIAYAEKQAARLPGLYRDRDLILAAPLPPQ
jgi:hypothetical protein